MHPTLQALPDPAILAISAATITGCAGIPGLFLRRPGMGQVIATVLTLLSSLVGIPAALALLFARSTTTYILEWGLPFGPCELAIDPLSAFFLLPIFAVAVAGSLFAVGYWPAAKHRSSEPGLTFHYGLLASSMALLVMARNGVFFLMAWEIMALSAYFLLITEHGVEEVRRAGIVYLIATHTGTAALFVYFSLLAAQSGSFLLPAARTISALAPGTMLIAATALLGFGAKAGIMPLHIWLPSAHANAPSHVSAIMSGVMLKMGLYGIFRTLTFFYDPPLLWGIILLAAGFSSALLGIAFAAAQRDLKRLLAYSSIENIGIITAALGGGVLGLASHNDPLAYLCLSAALLHILNHSLFKPLLFLGSGAVIHAGGTREMNLLGGLAKAMPKTALIFLAGVLAICGLPPLNGFASEFLLYLGLFSQLQLDDLAALALLAPVLALVGGLALITFTKLYSSVFLGTQRTPGACPPHEAGAAMLLPMGFFALLCILIGLLPQYALGLLSPVLKGFMPAQAVAALSPEYTATLGRLSWSGFLLAGAVLAAVLFWLFRMRRAPLSQSATWSCGYQRASARMQYVSSSFSEIVVSVFNGIIRQRIERPLLSGLFPGPSSCIDLPTETLLERIIRPLFTVAGVSFAFLRRLQHGQMHLYMIYIFATLFILMLWVH